MDTNIGTIVISSDDEPESHARHNGAESEASSGLPEYDSILSHTMHTDTEKKVAIVSEPVSSKCESVADSAAIQYVRDYELACRLSLEDRSLDSDPRPHSSKQKAIKSEPLTSTNVAPLHSKVS